MYLLCYYIQQSYTTTINYYVVRNKVLYQTFKEVYKRSCGIAWCFMKTNEEKKYLAELKFRLNSNSRMTPVNDAY